MENDPSGVSDNEGTVNGNGKVEKLTQTVESLTQQTGALVILQQESNERQAKDRKTLNRLTFLMIAKFLTLLLLLVLFVQLNGTAREIKHANATIQDCLVDTGKCSQKQNASTQLIIASLRDQGEIDRLQTEIPIAQAKSDDIGAQYRSLRLKQLQDRVAQINKDADDIRHDRSPTYPLSDILTPIQAPPFPGLTTTTTIPSK